MVLEPFSSQFSSGIEPHVDAATFSTNDVQLRQNYGSDPNFKIELFERCTPAAPRGTAKKPTAPTYQNESPSATMSGGKLASQATSGKAGRNKTVIRVRRG